MPKPVYFISDRPESYEVWGEVARDEAKAIAATIAAHAAARFPHVEFKICDTWNLHDERMSLVSAYIDKHWQDWAAEVCGQARVA